MALLGNLPNAVTWGLAVLIAYLERRDPAQAAPADEGTTSTASAPAPNEPPPPQTESDRPATVPAEEPVAPSRNPDLAARLLEADEVPLTPTPSGPSAPAAPDDRARLPTAAAPDPLVDARPGQTIVGPDAPIHAPELHVPAGALPGDGTPTCPDDHPFKGNASSMIYHSPGQPNYDRTVAEFCFESEATAEAAGYRPPKR